MVDHDDLNNNNDVIDNVPDGIVVVSPSNDSLSTTFSRRRRRREHISSDERGEDNESMDTLSTRTYENDFHYFLFDWFNPGNSDTPRTMDLTPPPLSRASRRSRVQFSPLLPRQVQEPRNSPQQQQQLLAEQDIQHEIPSLVEIQINLFGNDGLSEGETETVASDNAMGVENDTIEEDQNESSFGFARFFLDPSSNEWSRLAYQMDGLDFPGENESCNDHDFSIDASIGSDHEQSYSREWRTDLESIAEE